MTLYRRYPSLQNDTLPDVLQLIRTLNVGPITFFQLIERFGTAGSALDALPEMSVRGGRRKPLIPFDREQAQQEIASTEKIGARMIMYGEADYPQLLLTINDPPPVIAVLGHTHLWDKQQLVAMVGARNASANGCQFAQSLARQLGDAGIRIVSGLARGIDTFAHRGALNTGTIGVIAGGIDNIYPPENEKLYDEIKAQGAIISEQAFGAIPFSGSFPGRNRIIAGMSLGTVVVEASPKSGSLITARLAVEYDREVFAVPGSPLDPRAKGCNQLLRQGATLAESAADVLQGIARLHRGSVEENTSDYASPESETASPQQVDEARKIILEKIGAASVAIDTLIEQCELPASAILTALLELELAGNVKRGAGNTVALAYKADDQQAAG